MEADDKYRFVAGVVVVRNPTVSLKVNNTEDDIHSPYRQPNKKLYLCVKKPRNDHAWQFPQGGIKKKESIQQGALRELKEECGEDIKVELMDRSHPVCIYQYDFPAEFLKRSKRKYIGAKVQFIRVEWISGQCKPDEDEIIDFAWLTEEEISQFVSSEYLEGVRSIFAL